MAKSGFTISADGVDLPASGDTLLYRIYTYTNDFGAGLSMNLAGDLQVAEGATLVQKSGNLCSSAKGSIYAATVVVEGSSAGLVFKNIDLAENSGGNLVVRHGATVTVTNSMVIRAGASVLVENATLKQNTSSTSYSITMKAGATLRVSNSTLEFPGTKGALYIDSGATVGFDGAEIKMNGDVGFGGSGAEVVFSGKSSSFNRRFNMVGDNFTFCITNTTVCFSPATASDLFVTGGRTENENNGRTLRFCGAAPRLEVASSGGFYLRGAKGITLQFDIGRDGFPTDAAIVEITGGGSFKGDATACAASRIVVNVGRQCPPGTYVLLKGKNASTFLTGEDKWVTNSDRAKIFAATVDGLDAVQVTVKPVGFVLVVR